MFADALKKAFKFTRPVVISSRKHSGKCVSGIGAYVVLNPEGWIITAGHIAQEILGLDQAVVSHQEREAQRLAVEADSDLTSKQKQRRMKSLRPGRESVTNYSTWWGHDALTIRNFQIIALADIAVGQLEGFDPAWVSEYPAIKDPSSGLAVGTSLCRLGFPLHEISPSFDTSTKRFSLPEGSVPPPFFPIEGILTRHLKVGDHDEGFTMGFIETSSPGLRGQSGGPILDRQGAVWGIQSKTMHYELGFAPQAKQGGGRQKEHQFLNAGWATHPETIVGFLDSCGISFTKTEY